MADATVLTPGSNSGQTFSQPGAGNAFSAGGLTLAKPSPTTTPTVVTNANVTEKAIPNNTSKLASISAPPPQGGNNAPVPIYNANTGESSTAAPGANLGPGWSYANGTGGSTGKVTADSSLEDIMAFTNGGQSPTATSILQTDPILKAEYDQIQGLKNSNDAEYNSTVANIKSLYTDKITKLEAQQKASTASINQSLNLSGSSQYAPISSQGILDAKTTSDINELTTLQNEENDLIAKAQSAKSANDEKTVNDTIALYDKKHTELLAQAQKVKDTLQKEKDDINALAVKAKEGGATDDVIKSITNSPDYATAIKSAGNYLQTATGQLGDYLQYKKDATASGLVPEDYGKWKAEDDARQAKVKSSEAYATAFATAKGKAAGETSATGGSSTLLPVTADNGLTYQVPASVAPYTKIATNGVKYVDASGLSAAEKGKIKIDAFNGGVNPVPVITDPNTANDVQNITDATLKLKDMKDAFTSQTIGSAAERDLYYAAGLTIAKKLQTDPKAVGLDIYQDAALDILKAMSGTKGFRGGTSMIEQVQKTFPKVTDTTEVVNQKIANMQKLIDDRQTGLIGAPSAGDKLLIDAKNAESNLTSNLAKIKTTNPSLYGTASNMYVSVNPATGQPYSAADILQAFPELAK